MGRRAKAVPGKDLHVVLEKAEGDLLEKHLWSEFEGRVPQGSYQRFLTTMISDYFRYKHLDLAPYSSFLPGEHVIIGEPATIDMIEQALRERKGIL